MVHTVHVKGIWSTQWALKFEPRTPNTKDNELMKIGVVDMHCTQNDVRPARDCIWEIQLQDHAIKSTASETWRTLLLLNLNAS